MSISTNVLSRVVIDCEDNKLAAFQGLSNEELSQATFAAKRALVAKVLSKLEPSAEDRQRADVAAMDLFVRNNQRMREFRIWETYVPERWEDELVGCFKKAVYDFFYPSGDPLVLSLGQIFHQGSLGAGSNLSAMGTDFYTKLFSSPLGVTTVALYDAYSASIKDLPLWEDAEKQRKLLGFGLDYHHTSRVTCVPKNVTISRTICVEPTLNMFYQLGLGTILRGRLKTAFGIDLASQPERNRELARVGSIDGSLCTIDLSSASDSISLSLFRDLVPRYQAAFFELLRAQRASLPDGTELELGMLSTMGNGFTFPFQTMLFSCMVKASYAFIGRKFGRAGSEWSVFGDDIICHRDCVRPLLRLLQLTGFTVNEDKTFVEGPFRESCGCDYFRGHNIRPVYIRKLASQEDRYTTINRLVEWCAQTGLRLHETISYLKSTVKWRPVPFGYGHSSGVAVPLNLATGLKANRNGTLMVHVREAVARKLRVEGNRVVVPKGEKVRQFNDAGLILAILHGCYGRDGIGVRSTQTRYRTRVKPAPSWHGSFSVAGGYPAWRLWVEAARDLL